ncbi:MAG: (d)CMP kinase [Gemmatimonadaceae bacterium]
MDDRDLKERATKARLHVAIDGPAGAGKSTVGREMAGRLDCAFLDTGLMYRAVAWLALQAGIQASDAERLKQLAAKTEFESARSSSSLLVNGLDRESELRSAEVDAIVSEVSAHPKLRRELVDKQRAFASGRYTVMVGRDIGTTVLPGAQVKLWITATAEERARRRFKEHLAGSGDLSLAALADHIRKRDAIDASRVSSPLRRAEDAVILMTDELDVDAAVQLAMELVQRAVGGSETNSRE